MGNSAVRLVRNVASAIVIFLVTGVVVAQGMCKAPPPNYGECLRAAQSMTPDQWYSFCGRFESSQDIARCRAVQFSNSDAKTGLCVAFWNEDN